MTDFDKKMAIKRVFDVCVAGVGVVILCVPMAILALIIFIVDGEMPIFAQKRVGQYGALFVLYKFCTMRKSKNISTITTDDDLRITPLGGVMRRLKIDELPELYNIIGGTMSFVGARPDVPGYADLLQNENRNILQQKPGITGIASLKYRNEQTILAHVENPQTYNDTVIYPDKTRLNLWYFNNFGLWLDIKIILKTIFGSIIKINNAPD